LNKALEVTSDEQLPGFGSIHIDLPGRALIHIERNADPEMGRYIDCYGA